MNCTELRSDLMLYVDNILSDGDSSRVRSHLDECPVCRQVLTETQQIRSGLNRMGRPELKAALRTQLKASVSAELRSRRTRLIPVPVDVREWLMTRLMPLGVGVMASLVMGIGFLSLMLSTSRTTPNVAGTNNRDSILPASNRDPLHDGDSLSAYDYAQTRLDISSESPSINPQGALIALTRSLVRGGMKDDEVVVVADVFGNGLAQIAEVVEPSRDRRAVAELQKALASDPAYSPFVAANLDNRSDNVRVVLKFQSVNVPTHTRGLRR
jgi:hypothetical protein